MRIIGGEYKSRSIAMPRGVEMRPTQDKVREALFNILGDINGKKILELFAGSGAFGIEAISRGAGSVTFVDNNFRCVQTIKSNLRSLDVPDSKYNIIKADALKSPAKLNGACEKYDIIFLDPPYYRDMAKKCLINIDSCDIVAPVGLVIVEHFKKDALDTELERLVFIDERRYGDTVITILRRTL
ncbi:MAG: 16S rRNA (guanine(966)-N(2))-methyltransferase RsmD, partial [Candidatus Omnitrophota bacterium]|nr:16S rRNA (guanine(966)-N(2))-methyltransferase RsmD [Candidatus Omnitrophota bacterium]